MTKRHFQALADAPKDQGANRRGDLPPVANVCSSANGNFDRGRFARRFVCL
jgi:hypothetical protein